MRSLAMLLAVFLLVACAGSPVRLESESARNRESLVRLQIGQTKEEVLAIMGKPYKTEMYLIDGKQTEFWLILTAGYCCEDSAFTPLAIENGVLKGWGRNYYDTALRIKKEVTVKQE
jgi:hypothetical protein